MTDALLLASSSCSTNGGVLKTPASMEPPRVGLVECYTLFRTRGRVPPSARIGEGDTLMGVRCDELPQRITFFFWDEEDPVTGEYLGIHVAAAARLTRDGEPALVSSNASVLATHGVVPLSMATTVFKTVRLLGDLASALRLDQ